MSLKLHVSNLSNSTRESDLVNAFNNIGLVMSVLIPKDAKGNPKNYGFVNMGTPEGAQAGIKLNGTMLGERQIAVREATETEND